MIDLGPPEPVWDRFWEPLGAKMLDCDMIFQYLLVVFATDCIGPPRPRGTKQLDRKLLEYADNFRNMQRASSNQDADTKTPILNLQATRRKHLHQAPISKIGGGGARAARRIRIRRPRLLAAGLEAC